MVTASGDQMSIIGSSQTHATCNGKKTEIEALIAQRLTHDMIVSWKDCVSLGMLPVTLPLPPPTRHKRSYKTRPAKNLLRRIKHSSYLQRVLKYKYKGRTLQSVYDKANPAEVSNQGRGTHRRQNHQGHRAIQMVLPRILCPKIRWKN